MLSRNKCHDLFTISTECVGMGREQGLLQILACYRYLCAAELCSVYFETLVTDHQS